MLDFIYENFDITIYMEQSKLIIKSKPINSSTEYMVKIGPEFIFKSKLINSLDILYEILFDGLSSQTDKIQIKINHDPKLDQIIINLNLDFKYFQESFEFSLVKLSDILELEKMQKIENYIKNLETRVELLENQIQIVRYGANNLLYW